MIRLAPIQTHKIRQLIEDIVFSREELTKLVVVTRDDFIVDRARYAQTEHYFRRGLEAILTAATHILSRVPLEAKDYAAVIDGLGKAGIVEETFAQRNKGLAGYRNRLVHLYWEVSPEELYDTVKDHLEDFDAFAVAFQRVLQEPKTFNLTLET
jgi:uncharacterized protein YutE (UPF0331/DUF86 family)